MIGYHITFPNFWKFHWLHQKHYWLLIYLNLQHFCSKNDSVLLPDYARSLFGLNKVFLQPTNAIKPNNISTIYILLRYQIYHSCRSRIETYTLHHLFFLDNSVRLHSDHRVFTIQHYI